MSELEVNVIDCLNYKTYAFNRDNGMSADEAERLFEPGFGLKNINLFEQHYQKEQVNE